MPANSEKNKGRPWTVVHGLFLMKLLQCNIVAEGSNVDLAGRPICDRNIIVVQTGDVYVAGLVRFVIASKIEGGTLTAVETDVTEPEVPVNAPANGVCRVFVDILNMDTQQVRCVIVGGDRVLLIFCTLNIRRRDHIIIFNGHVFEGDIVDIRIIHIHAVQNSVHDMNDVAIGKDDVADFFGSGLCADFQALAPVVVKNTVADPNIAEHIVADAVVVHISFVLGVVKALNADAVIKGTQETVVDDHIFTVVHIDAVGIIPPATNNFHIADVDILTAHGADVIDQGVPDGDAINADAGAVFQLDGVFPVGIINGFIIEVFTGFKEDGFFVTAVVQNAVA